MRRNLVLSLFAAALGLSGWAADPAKPDEKKTGDLPPAASTATSDVDFVEKNLAARKEYENSLKKLWEHYKRTGDKQRIKWVEDELLGSMGVPIKLMINDQPVFICCKACEKRAKKDPEKTLQKVSEMKAAGKVK